MAGDVQGLILDVDPGHDDAVAMLLALRWPGHRVLGIVATAGNQTLDRTVANARGVVALAGSSVPVAAGRRGPLVASLVTSPAVHGERGLEGVTLDALGPLSPLPGPRFMAEIVENSTGPVTVVACGPLTNVASFILGFPDVATRLDRVVIMGGAVAGGNITAGAEFNFHVDPEAAQIVLRSGLNLTVVGLDVTHKALVYCADIALIEALGTSQARAVATWLRFYGAAYRRGRGWDGVPVHDACALLEAVCPGLVTTEPMAVDVETGGRISRGAMVVDERSPATGFVPNARVGVSIDRDRFLGLLVDGLKRY